MTDLDKLIAAVEADENLAPYHWIIHRHFGEWVDDFRSVALFRSIMDGSIEAMGAAHTLHKAVLPEWWVNGIFEERPGVTFWTVHLTANSRPVIAGRDYTPARAWLLAILRAMTEREDG